MPKSNSSASSSMDSIDNLTKESRDATVKKLLRFLKSIDNETDENLLESVAKMCENKAHRYSRTISEYQKAINDAAQKLSTRVTDAESTRVTDAERKDTVQKLTQAHQLKPGSFNPTQIGEWAELTEASIYYLNGNSKRNYNNSIAIIISSVSGVSDMNSITQESRNKVMDNIFNIAKINSSEPEEDLKQRIKSHDEFLYRTSLTPQEYEARVMTEIGSVMQKTLLPSQQEKTTAQNAANTSSVSSQVKEKNKNTVREKARLFHPAPEIKQGKEELNEERPTKRPRSGGQNTPT